MLTTPLHYCVYSCIIYSNTVTNNGKTTPTPLTDWSDSYQHPGLVCALTAGTCNLVTFLLKPDIIQVLNVHVLYYRKSGNFQFAKISLFPETIKIADYVYQMCRRSVKFYLKGTV